VLLSAAAAQRALAASSTDYPGPCSGEATATSLPATPLYLSADVDTRERHAGFIIMPEVGRLRLGISCVSTYFIVVRAGPDSALCTSLGLCTEDAQGRVTVDQLAAIQSVPNQLLFFHDCVKHGFGWYDELSVPPGYYMALAWSYHGVFFSGHGTMDTYAFFGNGGVYQPVNCAPPGGGGGGGGGDDGGGGDLILY
jgi:hypothetical protein